jgi:hypothetical protein
MKVQFEKLGCMGILSGGCCENCWCCVCIYDFLDCFYGMKDLFGFEVWECTWISCIDELVIWVVVNCVESG